MLKRTDITWGVRLFRVITLRGTTEDTYSDFRRFQVDSQLVIDASRVSVFRAQLRATERRLMLPCSSQDALDALAEPG